MNLGGIGEIQEGKFKGRKFIIPNVVLVENGTFLNGSPQFSRACLKHEIFIPDSGCPECKKENK